MKYVALLLILFPFIAFAKSSDLGQGKPPVCSDVTEQMQLAAAYVGPINFVVQFSRDKEARLILFLQQPPPKSAKLRWRLIERQEESLNYCVLGQGEGSELLGDMHLSNPSGKYGMPGSGLPRCAGKQASGLPGSLDIRMWANKELGNSRIYDLPSPTGPKDFVAIFSTDNTGAWIILDNPHGTLDDTCYYARGEASKIVQNFKFK